MPVFCVYMHDLQLSHFLQNSLPPTTSSHHNSRVAIIYYSASTVAFLFCPVNRRAVKIFICSRWICAIQQSEQRLQGGLTSALHSAASELFNHGMVYTANLLSSLLPLTPPLSTVCFIHQHQHIYLKWLHQTCKRMLPCPSPVWKQRVWKGETSLKGDWGRLPQPGGEAWALDEAVAGESTINNHGKTFWTGIFIHNQQGNKQKIYYFQKKLLIPMPDCVIAFWCRLDSKSDRKCYQTPGLHAKNSTEDKI